VYLTCCRKATGTYL